MRILISGCSRGIGRYTMEALAGRGHEVFAGMRSPNNFAGNVPAGVTILPLDVCCDESVERCSGALGDKPLDGLINNAAINPEGDETIVTLSPAMCLDVLNTNVVGPYRLLKAFLPQLRKSESPAAVFISSMAGSLSRILPYSMLSYGASKAALNRMVRDLSRDPELRGIVVTAVTPGWVRTDMGGSSAELDPAEVGLDLARLFEQLDARLNGAFVDRYGRSETTSW